MSNGPHVAKATCVVVVAGGAGTGTFTATGTTKKAIISGIPLNTTTLDFDITDSDNDGVTGFERVPVTGLAKANVDVAEGLCKGLNTITVSNMDRDGTLTFKIPYQPAFSSAL